MSQENVEIVKRGFEHFLATGEHAWQSIDPNVEVHDHNSPDQSTYRGHAGMARWVSDWSAAWETWSIEPGRFIDAGDRVVAIYRMSVRGKGSGLELDHEEAQVWTIRSGQGVRLDLYGSREKALEAVRLSEQDAPAGS